MQFKIQFESRTHRHGFRFEDADPQFSGSLDFVRGVLLGWKSYGHYKKTRIRMTDETRQAYIKTREERERKCPWCNMQADIAGDLCNDCDRIRVALEYDQHYRDLECYDGYYDCEEE